MVAQKQSLRRCTFDLPIGLYNDLYDAAEKNETTLTDMLRKYIRLGLLASEPDTVVLLKQGSLEQPVRLIL
jgi:hypothetical protein